jgi:hypothetical protein
VRFTIPTAIRLTVPIRVLKLFADVFLIRIFTDGRSVPTLRRESKMKWPTLFAMLALATQANARPITFYRCGNAVVMM